MRVLINPERFSSACLSILITRGRMPPVPDSARRRKSLAAVRFRLGDNLKSLTVEQSSSIGSLPT